MSADYEIVKYRPEHKLPVAELQRQLWSLDTRLNARYFEWKYENNPRLREPAVYLALHRGKPVGMRGFHEARLEAGMPSHTFPVLVAGDALIDTAHRDRGLVTRIMKLAYAELAGGDYTHFVSIGGASRINALGLMGLGWKSSGGLQPMGRVSARAVRGLRLRSLASRLPVFWRFSEARFLYGAEQRNPFRRLDAAIDAFQGNGAPIAIAREPRLDAMVDLIRRRGHDGRIRYVRDRDYLTWRFRSPLSEYRFLFHGAENLDGYLVLSRKVGDLGAFERVYIADLEADNMQVRKDLLAAAIDCGRFPELVTWTASLSAEELQLLRDHAFQPVDLMDAARGVPGIMVRPVAESESSADWILGDQRLLDSKRWDVRVLYSMRG